MQKILIEDNVLAERKEKELYREHFVLVVIADCLVVSPQQSIHHALSNELVAERQPRNHSLRYLRNQEQNLVR